MPKFNTKIIKIRIRIFEFKFSFFSHCSKSKPLAPKITVGRYVICIDRSPRSSVQGSGPRPFVTEATGH